MPIVHFSGAAEIGLLTAMLDSGVKKKYSKFAMELGASCDRYHGFWICVPGSDETVLAVCHRPDF